MWYAPKPDTTIDLSSLSDKWLKRLYIRVWERIDYRYGSCTWDWPTLWTVYPEFAVILRSLSKEAKRRELY